MSSIYTKSMQIFNAEQFKASIGDATDPYVYFTIGKVEPWSSESFPTQPESSMSTYYQVWKNMIGVKKIVGNDVRLAIRRFDWNLGDTYIAYDDNAAALNMNDANTKFYVVTDEWNVYKCLANNNGGISTVKPTNINTYIAEQGADKYVWKYMYTLTDEEKLRFTTANFIPVRTLTEDNGSLQWHVQQNAVQGSLGSIRVTNPGSGYSASNNTPVVNITGDGSDAAGVATVNTSTTAIESILITNKGKNYTYANVSITAGVGSGAEARAVINPPGGHGSNPVEELGASFVIINPRLKGSESDILDVQNEIRQVSFIKNPKLFGSDALATGLVYSQTMAVTMDSVGDNYVEDEYVFQGTTLATATFRARVVSWNSALNLLNLIDISGNISNDPLTGDTSKASRQVQSWKNQSLEPYTGTLLYINNITPIQRATDQTEDFKIVVSF